MKVVSTVLALSLFRLVGIRGSENMTCDVLPFNLLDNDKYKNGGSKTSAVPQTNKEVTTSQQSSSASKIIHPAKPAPFALNGGQGSIKFIELPDTKYIHSNARTHRFKIKAHNNTDITAVMHSQSGEKKVIGDTLFRRFAFSPFCSARFEVRLSQNTP